MAEGGGFCYDCRARGGSGAAEAHMWRREPQSPAQPRWRTLEKNASARKVTRGWAGWGGDQETQVPRGACGLAEWPLPKVTYSLASQPSPSTRCDPPGRAAAAALNNFCETTKHLASWPNFNLIICRPARGGPRPGLRIKTTPGRGSDAPSPTPLDPSPRLHTPFTLPACSTHPCPTHHPPLYLRSTPCPRLPCSTHPAPLHTS